MAETSYESLAKLLWSISGDINPGGSFVAANGDKITVKECGTSDSRSGNFTGARVQINDTEVKGDVTFVESGYTADDRVILHVCLRSCDLLYNNDGELIPQILLPVNKQVWAFYDELIENSHRYHCAHYISRMDSIMRYGVFLSLLSERMEDRYNEVMEYHASGEGDWNHTLYVMLFRAMGSPSNKDPFVKLAQTVPYNIVFNEKSNQFNVETLLLGSSGLLFREDYNPLHKDEVREARKLFDVQKSKYNLKPMNYGEFTFTRQHRFGVVQTRIAQLASLLCHKGLLLDRTMSCRTLDDVCSLFDIKSSTAWSDGVEVSIGANRSQVLGINYVVPVMFAYGKQMDDTVLQDDALELLDRIPAEVNGIISSWSKAEVDVSTAYESQAMLQLSKLYCSKRNCAECKFGKRQIREKVREFVK